jgi:hypothetical protein
MYHLFIRDNPRDVFIRVNPGMYHLSGITQGMCHSFIRVSLAQVTRNLSAGNSRELAARKTINKPTTNTCCFSATHTGVHSSGLTTWLFSSSAPAPIRSSYALEFSLHGCTSSKLSFFSLSFLPMHKNLTL